MSIETTAPATDPSADEVSPVDITPGALELVRSARDEEDDPSTVALRVEITGVRAGDFTYDLSFAEFAEAEVGDVVALVDDVTVWVPAASVDDLRGSVLDLPVASAAGGLVLRNPNRPDPLGGVDLDAADSVEEKIELLLEAVINPGLASHGGFASLVGVEEGRAFVTMGGGCQGCAMSQATLVQGIQATIVDAIPEVSEVVDATDHGAGENPFYS